MADIERKDSNGHSSDDPEKGSIHKDRAIVEVEPDVSAHLGVKKVEAAAKVYGKYSRWVLFISLGLASYIYSLDGTTTYAYLTFATSAFGGHGVISSIQTAQSIIIAVGKPVIAKVADVTSRATAYFVVLMLYVIGYIVIASANNVGTVGGGIVIYAIGYTGLQLLTQIVVADITTLRWRGLVSSLMFTPFLVNAFVGSNIAADVIEGAGWRWGYGMFAILVPAALSPLIVTLFWAERKAKRLGIVPIVGEPPEIAGKTPFQKRLFYTKRFAEHLDLIGLLLLSASVSLILLPLTLSRTVSGGWNNGSIIAMLVIGIALIPVFGLWDFKYASRPVIPFRFMKNRTIVIGSLIGFFDFLSFYLTFTYLYVFVVVVKPWSLVDANYFMQTQTVALTFFGIIAGFSMTFIRRYKVVLCVGLAIRTLGVGLMIHSRGVNGSTVEIVWTQILQGMGGGFASVSAQVGAQASVTHTDIATVTAAVLLLTEIGGAIGTAIAGAIWTNTMPDNLLKYVPFISAEERDTLYNNIPFVLAFERGHPVREGVIQAYDDTMRLMVIVSLVFAIVPMLLALLLPNWYLGDGQNAVDEADLTGERKNQNPHNSGLTKNS